MKGLFEPKDYSLTEEEVSKQYINGLTKTKTA